MTLIYILFFFSGASALIYEVAWLRLLSLSFGNTTEASSCVISVFLGGLALGAFLGGRLADRITKGHLALYGWLEVTIGVLAPFISLLLYKLPDAVVWISHAMADGSGSQMWVRFALATLILLPPTVLMGASLPILCKHLELRNLFNKDFTVLYGVNMLGGVFGGLDGCVIGFAHLGIMGTILVAAAFNLYVGLRAITKKEQGVVAAPIAQSEARNLFPNSDFWLLCLIAGLSGFNSLSYEILWISFVKSYVVPDVYAFAFTVSCFILGLTGGSLALYFRRGERSIKRNLFDLSIAQILAGLLCACSLMAFPSVAHWYHQQSTHFYNLLAICVLLVALPSMAIGLTFPIIGALGSSFKKLSSYVGLVYALNTAGCVIGTLFVGLYAQPTWGSFVVFKLNILLSALIASVVLLRCLDLRKPLMVVGCVAPLLAAAGFFIYHPDPFLTATAKMKSPLVDFYEEDTTGIVWVLNYPQFKALKTNLALMSSTSVISKRYMRLLGILPVLACKTPEDALVVCFGTGTTAGATTAVNDVKRVDIVDLSPAVIRASDCFSDSNLGVLHNPKSTVYVNDGRNFLLNTKRNYDVITFEPPPLFSAGVVNLYTTEFYQLVKRHLKPGGVAAQWVPSFGVGNTLWRMILRSFTMTFPYSSLWISNSGEGIILGSESPLEFDLKVMKDRIDSSPELARSLDEVGLSNPLDILATFVMGGQRLNDYTANAKPITDDHPYMEYYSPFLGVPKSDWEICKEAGDMEQNLKDSVKVTGADSKLLKDSFQSMQDFRLSETSLWANQTDKTKPSPESQESIQRAIRLNQANKFFSWYAKYGGAVQDTMPEMF